MQEELFPGARIMSYALLVCAASLAILPFLYMISLSLQTDAETLAGVPVIIPEVPQYQNYVEIWDRAPFGRFVLNSFIVASAIALAHLFFDPLAGYVFAKFKFPFKNVIFIIVLGTLMIPFFVRMVPLYMMMARLGWLNSYQGLITPFLMGAYGIFLMRQFIQPIPDELIDAARIDGASEFGIFWRIVLPQTKPALATLGLFVFIYQWNEFLWPLVVVNTMEMRTMTIGLTLFNRESYIQWNMTATAGMIMFIPGLILFLFSQRYFIRGIVLSGMK
jgi:multiple sugar transport system permease protein